MATPQTPQPNSWVIRDQAYAVRRHPAPIDLFLDGNEGLAPDPALLEALSTPDLEVLRRYPDASQLQRRLAERMHVAADRVLVTAGADEALDRISRAFLGPDRELVLPVPTFEMIPRYAAMVGAVVREVAWTEGAYPTDQVQATVTERTGVIAVVSPNNPSGAVATAADICALAEQNPGILILVDLAYVEFADEDPTGRVLPYPNVVVTRTLSKAWGLAGLRVGYAVADRGVIAALRGAGGPYSVAGTSVRLAERALAADAEADRRRRRYVDTVNAERRQLWQELTDAGIAASPSQANFVLLRDVDAVWLRDGLAGLGVAVRAFPNRAGLERALRITCPGDAASFQRLCRSLRTVLRPQALLLDMDGVLADVSGSYRVAIQRTARSFGAEVTQDDIQQIKDGGDANNDWEVTRRLLVARGIEVSLADVTRRFEELYQGTPEAPGLWTTEQLLPDRDVLAAWADRLPLAVVTGRPRSDTERFLQKAGIEDLITTCVCLEDGPPKPDPAPVRLALTRLGVERAWMLGDTPDDVQSARGAGVLPLAVVPPGLEAAQNTSVTETLLRSGAARVLTDLADLVDLLEASR